LACGDLVKQNYREGAPVKKGEPLFEIDPRPFAASVAQAGKADYFEVLQVRQQLFPA